jgi:hypothetical protein
MGHPAQQRSKPALALLDYRNFAIGKVNLNRAFPDADAGPGCISKANHNAGDAMGQAVKSIANVLGQTHCVGARQFDVAGTDVDVHGIAP